MRTTLLLLRSSRGFTLIEMLFVLAIIAVLAGIIVALAISAIGEADTAKTRSDEDAIAAALTKFRTDVKQWPDGTAKDFHYLLAGTTVSSAENQIDTAECPTEAVTSFFTDQSCSALTTTQKAQYNAYNHFAVNNPDGTATPDQATDYSGTRWKGPYLGKLGRDPFGKAYVVYMRGIDKNFTGGNIGRGWVISAGPDAILQTKRTDTSLAGDDIGYIFCTNCP